MSNKFDRFGDKNFARQFGENQNSITGGDVMLAEEVLRNMILSAIINCTREENRRILEIAAGTAKASRMVAQSENFPIGTTITATDTNESQLELARELIKEEGLDNIICTNNADMTNLPYGNEVFKVIAMKKGIHEIRHQLQKRVWKEVARLLSPNGSLVLWADTLGKTLSTESREKIYRCKTLDELMCLEINTSEDFIHAAIRLKDLLANNPTGFDNRYFPSKEEIVNDLNQEGLELIATRENAVFNYGLMLEMHIALKHENNPYHNNVTAYQAFARKHLFNDDSEPSQIGLELGVEKALVNQVGKSTLNEPATFYQFRAQFDLMEFQKN